MFFVLKKEIVGSGVGRSNSIISGLVGAADGSSITSSVGIGVGETIIFSGVSFLNSWGVGEMVGFWE